MMINNVEHFHMLIGHIYIYTHIQCLFKSFTHFYFLICFIDYAITVVSFSPSALHTFSHLQSSTPLAHVHGSYICSLASIFPILFLTSPCLSSTYYLCYLFSVSFPPLSPSHSPTDNPPRDLYYCDSVPVLVVCLVCFFFFFLGLVVNSCEFVVILLFIFLMFFFLDKSL